MAVIPPRTQQITNALIDFRPLNQGVSNLGNALAQARNQENRAAIGEAAQGGNLAAARDMAMRGGYLNEGMAFGNALAQRKAQQDRLALARQKMAQGPKPTAAQQNFEYAQRNPAFAKYQQSLKRNTNVTVNTGEKAFHKEMGKSNAKFFQTTQVEGGKASKNLGQLRIMQKALSDPNLYTGVGGDWVQGVKKSLQAAGLKGIKGIESGEMAQRLSKGIALSHKGDLPGPLSNSDRQFLESLPAGLSKSAEGNRWLIELGVIDNQYKIDRAQAAREYMQANGGILDSGFYTVLGELNSRYVDQYSGLVDKLRGQTPAEPKSPLAGIPSVTSAEQWNSLQRGQKYLDPNGVERTKR